MDKPERKQLRLYFPNDIRNGLRATLGAIVATAHAHDNANVEFVEGAVLLAKALAANFGVEWKDVDPGLPT